MGLFDLFKGNQVALIDQAFDDVKVMLKNGHEMFAAATARLLENEILDADLEALDHEINAREQRLRSAVMEHLVVNPARELYLSLILISIVHEAERIGDYAKSISEVSELADGPRLGPLVVPLRDIRDGILQNFARTREGFIEDDEVIARQLLTDHVRLKARLNQYIAALAARTDITPNEAVVYALGARMMSRVSSHLANIASTVAYPFEKIRRGPHDLDADGER